MSKMKKAAGTLLTKVIIDQAKPDTKAYVLADQNGLYLRIYPTGLKKWIIRTRIGGVESRRTIGKYPDMSLKEARIEASNINEELLKGHALRGPKLQQLAERWLAESVRKKAPGTEYINRLRFNYLSESTRHKTCGDVTRRDLVIDLQRIQKEHSYKTAVRTSAVISAVFNYGLDAGYLDKSPAGELSRVLIPDTPEDKVQKHYDAVTDPQDVGCLMRAIEKIPTQTTRLTLMFVLYTFVRQNELRQAEWREIDFEKRLWIIPASHTKRRRDQVVPLSSQAIRILEKQKTRTFTNPDALIFRSDIKGDQLPKTLLLNALKNLRDALPESERPPVTTVHGLRATASTLLNAAGWPADVIERQLAHFEQNKVRAAYNRFEYLQERTVMMQWYADYLDALRDGAPLPMPETYQMYER